MVNKKIIIYGWKEKFIKTIEVNQGKCQNCGNDNLIAHFFCKYFYIYWIPFVPVSKEIMIECKNCKFVIKENEMSIQEKELSDKIKMVIKYPKRYFVGLIIFSLLIIISLFIKLYNVIF